MDICVGNLPSDVTGTDVREVFEPFGRVETAHVMKHRHGGGSRSFGFVAMPARSEAVSAILGLDGKHLKGRAITATEVRPRDPVCGACRTPCYCRSHAQAAGNARPIPAAFRKGEGGNDTDRNRLE